MIQEYTILDVADNTGAKKIRCFKVLGGTRRRYARIGDVIVASVREASPEATVKTMMEGAGFIGTAPCRPSAAAGW